MPQRKMTKSLKWRSTDTRVRVGDDSWGFVRKPTMPEKETTADYQKRTFPARIKAVKEKTRAALAADKAVGKGHKSLTREQRAGHQRALAAAKRVEKRMGIGKQKKESVETVVRPDKGKSTPKSRRRVVEKATGTSAITDRLRGVRELTRAAKGK